MGRNRRLRMRSLARATPLFALVCLLAACDGGEEKSKAPGGGNAPAETVTAETPGPTSIGPSGSLMGRVTFGGDPTPTEAFNVNIDQKFCTGKVMNETLVIQPESRAIKNVVVTINGVKDGQATPSTLRLTNKNCNFEPHVLAAVKGSKLEVANEDPVNHTTQGLLPSRTFMNNSIAAGTSPLTKTLRRKGIISMRCDVHKWMTAWVFVHENDHFSVTDDAGIFSIDNVPPGTYNVKAWHETLGEKETTVTIEPGKKTSHDFSFK